MLSYLSCRFPRVVGLKNSQDFILDNSFDELLLDNTFTESESAPACPSELFIVLAAML
jgi:hypothetical protein